MLADTPTKDDHARLYGSTSVFVQCSDVANDVQNQTGRPERMEVDHISDGAIRQRGTKNRDIVLWQSSAERARERRNDDVFTLYAQ